MDLTTKEKTMNEYLQEKEKSLQDMLTALATNSKHIAEQPLFGMKEDWLTGLREQVNLILQEWGHRDGTVTIEGADLSYTVQDVASDMEFAGKMLTRAATSLFDLSFELWEVAEGDGLPVIAGEERETDTCLGCVLGELHRVVAYLEAALEANEPAASVELVGLA